MRKTFFGILVWFSLWACACPVLLEPNVTEITVECTDASHCKGSMVCYQNACVEVSTHFPDKKIWIYATFAKIQKDAKQQSYQSQHSSFLLGTAHQGQVELEPSIIKDSRLLEVLSEDDFQKNLFFPFSGTVLLRKTQAILEQSLPNSFTDQVFLTDEKGNFVLQSPRGEYDIFLIPQDKSLPTLYLSNFVVTEDKISDLPLSFLYLKYKLKKYKGQLTLSTQSNFQHPPDWKQNIRLAFYNAEGKMISSQATTDINGLFELTTNSNEKPHTLRIFPREGNLWHPEVQLLYSLVQGLEKKETINGEEIIQLGSLPFLYYQKNETISFQVVASGISDSFLLSKTQAVLQSDVFLGVFGAQSLTGRYILSLTQNNKGLFETAIPPGHYDLQLLPPADSGWDTAFFSDVSMFPSQVPVFAFAEKKSFSFCVQLLPETTCQKVGKVVASKVKNLSSQPHYKTVMHVASWDEKESYYKISLESGVYDLLVYPVQNEMAVLYLPNQKLDSTASQKVISVLVPKGELFFSTLKAKDGTPLSNVILEFYEANPDSNKPPIYRGKSISDSRGKFLLRLQRDE